VSSSDGTTAPRERRGEPKKPRGEAARRSRREHLDRKLDEALEETFPASDPIELSADPD
jgi:hypothetical protein